MMATIKWKGKYRRPEMIILDEDDTDRVQAECGCSVYEDGSLVECEACRRKKEADDGK